MSQNDQNRKLRIFIVDDHHDIADGLAEVLRVHGHEVEVAYSGEHAVRVFREKDFDIAFMDVMMPGMNGVESFLAIRRMKPNARVVMMTGYSVEQLLDQVVEKGAYGVLHKPVAMDDILGTLDRVKSNGMVLIADANPAFGAQIQGVLEKNGYRTSTARTGKEALSRVLSGGYDILLLGQSLPVLSGLEVFMELRKHNRAIPTIIVTDQDHAYDSELQDVYRFTTTGILTKPFNTEQLLGALDRLAPDTRIDAGSDETASAASADDAAGAGYQQPLYAPPPVVTESHDEHPYGSVATPTRSTTPQAEAPVASVTIRSPARHFASRPGFESPAESASRRTLVPDRSAQPHSLTPASSAAIGTPAREAADRAAPETPDAPIPSVTTRPPAAEPPARRDPEIPAASPVETPPPEAPASAVVPGPEFQPGMAAEPVAEPIPETPTTSGTVPMEEDVPESPARPEPTAVPSPEMPTPADSLTFGEAAPEFPTPPEIDLGPEAEFPTIPSFDAAPPAFETTEDNAPPLAGIETPSVSEPIAEPRVEPVSTAAPETSIPASPPVQPAVAEPRPTAERPARDETREDDNKRAAPAEPPSMLPSVLEERREGRILAVDDDVDMVEGLADVLRTRGYEVRTANTEAQAHEIIAEFDAEVALLDIRLGKSNGLDLITSLKERRPDLYCVMITGNADKESAITALKRGAYNYLTKPLHPNELFAVLENCFDKYFLDQKMQEAFQQLQKAKESAETNSQKVLEFYQQICGVLEETLDSVATCSAAITDERWGDIGAQQYLDQAGEVLNKVSSINYLLHIAGDLAKARIGTLEIAEDEVDIYKLVRSTAHMVKQALGDADRDISVDLPPQRATLWGDERLLKTALTNLVAGAVEGASADAEIHLAIRLVDDGTLTIDIGYEGDAPAGMGNANEEPSGSETARLSMSLVGHVARLHGGKVTAGQTASGALVRFVLPSKRVVLEHDADSDAIAPAMESVA